MTIRFALVAVLAVLFLDFRVEGEDSTGRVLDPKLHHLGSKVIDFWPGVSANPEGSELILRFAADENAKPWTLVVTYWDVNASAAITINGKEVAQLAPSQQKKTVYLPIAAKSFTKGENVLTITPKLNDDCVIGQVILHQVPFSEVLQLSPVQLSVTEAETFRPIPARITIATEKGELAQIYNAPTNGTAVRPGVLYMLGTNTVVYLKRGDYRIYATRGMEWSRPMVKVSLPGNKRAQVDFKLKREVDTTGFINADTHIHTLPFTGHGDAIVHERMITLAGEGVEMAVATDHNHQTDFRPFQQELGLNDYFTPVIGNEVTTKVGHFNAFPLKADGVRPNHTETNFVKIVNDIRAKGARVVILNHPRWGRHDVFKVNELNAVTGELKSGEKMTFDAMELVNSCALLNDPLQLFKDWFVLLNHGEKILAVGASDSHNVGSMVGQGRTYIRSNTDDADKINVDEVCTTFLAGDSSISMGIFADVKVEGKRMGQTVPVTGSQLSVNLRIAAPSWIKPKKALVYMNGIQVAAKKLSPKGNKAFDQTLTVPVPAPKHDAYLVCVVLGDGVPQPCWPTYEPYTLAATNPVFLDADNDGGYRSPRETAEALILGASGNREREWLAATQADDAIAIQVLNHLYKASNPVEKAALLRRIEKSAKARPAFANYLKTRQMPTVTPGSSLLSVE